MKAPITLFWIWYATLTHLAHKGWLVPVLAFALGVGVMFLACRLVARLRIRAEEEK